MDMKLLSPLIKEQWIVDGKVFYSRPTESNSLYITPVLNQDGLVSEDVRVLHSLFLDNNVLTDIIDNRNSLNIAFLENLLTCCPIELNPVYAMMEQRQKYVGATTALHEFSKYLEKRFGCSLAKENADQFDHDLEVGKVNLIDNIDLLSGYISAIIYFYHLDASASEKLEWLSGVVVNADIPYFQIHFYFAALVFLSKENPDLFHKKDKVKIKKDMEISNNFRDQKSKVMNLSNDLALLGVSIFPTTEPNQFVFPYIATGDRLLQLLLSEVTCGYVESIGDGKANGGWLLKQDGLLKKYLSGVIEKTIPRRECSSTNDDKLVRKCKLQAFSDTYTAKCIDYKKIRK